MGVSLAEAEANSNIALFGTFKSSVCTFDYFQLCISLCQGTAARSAPPPRSEAEAGSLPLDLHIRLQKGCIPLHPLLLIFHFRLVLK